MTIKIDRDIINRLEVGGCQDEKSDLLFKTPKAYKELGTIISKILCLPEKRKRYHHPLIKAKDLMCDRTESQRTIYDNADFN